MPLGERLLSAGLAVLRPLLPAASLLSPPLARAAAERRGVVFRLREWGGGPDPDRPLVWLHGASAGELIGAVPAVAHLRRKRELRLLVTYFSPSAESVLDLLAPDTTEVLPLDILGETRAAIAATEPDLLVFAKLDVWPNLTRAARERGVPLAMINATVRPGSSRLRWPVRQALRPAYARLRGVGAASEDDARRLLRLGVRPGALRVTGDASFDWALERARRSRENPTSAARILRAVRPEGVPTLVAGSTWREDEAVLLRAARELTQSGRPLWLVLVPHQPHGEAIMGLARECRQVLDREPILWSELVPEGVPGRVPGATRPRPLIVDTVGVLSELYGAADLAYVGGGFGTDGLHSVTEPAGAGLPVLFGPRHARREAGELLRRGGAREVRDAAGAAASLRELLASDRLRKATGRKARSYVEAASGAAVRGAHLMAEMLDAR